MKATLGQLLTPIVVVVLLVIFQTISNAVLSHSEPHPPTSPVPTLPRYCLCTGLVFACGVNLECVFLLDRCCAASMPRVRACRGCEHAVVAGRRKWIVREMGAQGGC